MQKITPNLWFEKDTFDAVSWYVSIFRILEITNRYFIYNTPSGRHTAELITFEVMGFEIVALGVGPMFKLNPSVSLLVTCTTKDPKKWMNTGRNSRRAARL